MSYAAERRREVQTMKKLLSRGIPVFVSCVLLLSAIVPAYGMQTSEDTQPMQAPATANESYALGITPHDVAFDGAFLYASARTEKKVYRIDIQDGTTTSLSFSRMPETLYFRDGKLFVGLCDLDHSTVWFDDYFDADPQTGAFAIIDCTNFSLIGQYPINTDPYDLVVSKDGYVYIASGSGQWTFIKAYTQTGTLIDSFQVRQQSTIGYNEQLNRIYTITSDSSPRNMCSYSLAGDGTFLSGSDLWPYHGDFYSETNFSVSPDGTYIFNGIGYTLECTADRDGDMVKDRDFYLQFNDVAFDIQANKIYFAATQNNYIHCFDYAKLMPLSSYEVQNGDTQFVFKTDTHLIAVNRSNVQYNVEKIALSNSVPPATDNDYDATELGEITGAVYSAETHKSYLLNKSRKLLLVYDHASEMITDMVHLLHRPDGIALSDNGSRLLIVNDNIGIAVTEYNVSTLEVTRELAFAVPPNADKRIGHRHVANYGDKLYFVDGTWEPALSIFDYDSFELLHKNVITGVGDFAVDSAGKYLYTWYQYGWSAGYAGSEMSKYDVSGAAPSLVKKTNLGYPTNFYRDPLVSPILLLEEQNILLCKNLAFSLTDLGVVGEQYFPSDLWNTSEAVLAINAAQNQIVTQKGIYDIQSRLLIKALNFQDTQVIIVDKNGDIFFAKGAEYLRYKPVALEVTAGSLSRGDTTQIRATAYYSDGTGYDVTSACSFVSNHTGIVSVSNTGAAEAIGFGTATVTVTYGELTLDISLVVDVYLDGLTIAGIDDPAVFSFSPNRLNYHVQLPVGTTVAPTVTPSCDGALFTTVVDADEIPGTTAIVVEASDGTSKTYTIYFSEEAPEPEYTELPFSILGSYYHDLGLVRSNIAIEFNPDYFGVYPSGYSVVLQLISPDAELMLVSALDDVQQISYTFSEDFLAIVSVVDRFGESGYVGIDLAIPCLINLDGWMDHI